MSGLKRQQSKGSGRLNARQYRELFEESHDAMAIIARDGTILDANLAASELFAWPHAEFLGMNIRSVYANPEDRARYQKHEHPLRLRQSRRPRPLPEAGRARRVRPRLRGSSSSPAAGAGSIAC